MATVTAKVDFRETLRALNRFQSKQLPFAIKGAIDTTAFQVKSQIISSTYPRAFTVRNKQFPKTAFRVDKSNKRARPIVAYVFDRFEYNFLPIHIKGGIRTPARSSSLAIPSRNIPILKSGKRSNAAKFKRGTFRANLKGRGEAVWQEYGSKKNRKVRLLYVLKPRVSVPKSFDVVGDARKVVRKRFNANMRRSLTYALRTAR